LQIPAENLLDDIRVLKVDGGLECGAHAYLFVAKHTCSGQAPRDAIRPTGVPLGVAAWVALVQPESLSRLAVLPVARAELDGGEGKTLV
jgi:hypothetical protein